MRIITGLPWGVHHPAPLPLRHAYPVSDVATTTSTDARGPSGQAAQGAPCRDPRRRHRRPVHGAPAAQAARQARGGHRRRRPAPVHDVRAVPARGRGRVHRPPQRRRPAPPRPQGRRRAAGQGQRDQPRRPHGPDHARGGRPVLDHLRPPGRRPRLGRPHAAHPRARGAGHRLQERRRGHRGPQPRAQPDRPRGQHLGPGAAQAHAHVRLRRRRVRRHRGARRGRGHGPRRGEVLQGHRAGGAALRPGRGLAAHPARGQRGARRVHARAAAQAAASRSTCRRS